MEHIYLSTACLHGEHDYCASPEGVTGPKKPSTCKFCDAECVCPHHYGESVPVPADTTPPDPTVGKEDRNGDQGSG